MKHHARMLILLGLLVAGLAFALVETAQAQTAAPSAPIGGVTSCSNYVGLSNRIVMCVRETLFNTTEVYFERFYPLVRGLIGGFLTLTIIIYGILAAFGMLEKPGRDVMVLLVKLTFVTYFVVNNQQIFDYVVRAMDAAGGAVVEYTPNVGMGSSQTDRSQVTCLQNMRDAATRSETKYSGAWLAMDCMIDTVIGIKIPENASGTGVKSFAPKGGVEGWYNRQLNPETRGLARGLINFFFSSMQSSVMGVLLAVIGFVFIYTIVWLVMKALFVYIAGYLGIAFLMIFAPLFIPLVLFRTTKQYFDKWVKLIVGFALQPIIILAFIGFAIIAIDLAMFSGSYSVTYRIAGEASRQQSFNLNDYLDEHGIVMRRPTVAAEIKTSIQTPGLLKDRSKGVVNDLAASRCTEALMRNDPKLRETCGQTYPVRWWRNSINWNKMAQIRQPVVADPGAEEGDSVSMTPADRQGRQISREVLGAVLFAAVVVFVINGLLSIVPVMVNDLVGESFQSPNLFREVARTQGGAGVNPLSTFGGMFGRRR